MPTMKGKALEELEKAGSKPNPRTIVNLVKAAIYALLYAADSLPQ